MAICIATLLANTDVLAAQSSSPLAVYHLIHLQTIKDDRPLA
jgi:hypothetical protein